MVDQNGETPAGLIGRQKEAKVLATALASPDPEFIAICGRRRVGKTFLIKSVIGAANCTAMEVSGLKDGKLQEQLANFVDALARTFHKSLITQQPKNWKEAFNLLTQEVERHGQQVVIFLDELPWLATKKSNLLQNLDYYWNNIWSAIPNFKLIVCGSAASWMLEKLIHNMGGLYNRITKSIHLQPFTLSETADFLRSRGVKLTHAQILDLYMVMGGIPHYLKSVEPGKSAAQNINAICFTQDGLLYTEFEIVFQSLFDASDRHSNIVHAIAKKPHGILRNDLLQSSGFDSGGDFEKTLNELIASGFIKKFVPYDKAAKGQFYKIVDEYTLFYLKWIAPLKAKSISLQNNYWQPKYNSPAWNSWAGYAYESVCYKHINMIMHKLGIDNIGCIVGSWKIQADKALNLPGAQIDLLFDRDDQVITICEIKHNDEPYVLDKKYALEIMDRNKLFAKVINTKKQLLTCFITKEPLKSNLWSQEVIDAQVTLEDLFG